MSRNGRRTNRWLHTHTLLACVLSGVSRVAWRNGPLSTLLSLKGEQVPPPHDLSALRLWRGSSLPHGAGLQPPPETAPAGGAPQEAMSVVGTHIPVSNGLGPGGRVARDAVWLRTVPERTVWCFEPLN